MANVNTSLLERRVRELEKHTSTLPTRLSDSIGGGGGGGASWVCWAKTKAELPDKPIGWRAFTTLDPQKGYIRMNDEWVCFTHWDDFE